MVSTLEVLITLVTQVNVKKEDISKVMVETIILIFDWDIDPPYYVKVVFLTISYNTQLNYNHLVARDHDEVD